MTISTSAIQNYVDSLKNHKFQSSTLRTYYNVWKNFNQFFVRLDDKPASWEDRIVLYVGYMVEREMQSATIASYISALKAVLKADGVEVNENRYLLSSLTNACKIKNDTIKIRLPIQKGLLSLMLKELRIYYGGQPYLSILYQALFSASYYGLLRVGEVSASPHVLKACDVQLGCNKRKSMLILRSSKTHKKSEHPQVIKLSHRECTTIPAERRIINPDCPYSLMNNYLSIRKSFRSCEEQFFIFHDREPLLPSHT